MFNFHTRLGSVSFLYGPNRPLMQFINATGYTRASIQLRYVIHFFAIQRSQFVRISSAKLTQGVYPLVHRILHNLATTRSDRGQDEFFTPLRVIPSIHSAATVSDAQ